MPVIRATWRLRSHSLAAALPASRSVLPSCRRWSSPALVKPARAPSRVSLMPGRGAFSRSTTSSSLDDFDSTTSRSRSTTSRSNTPRATTPTGRRPRCGHARRSPARPPPAPRGRDRDRRQPRTRAVPAHRLSQPAPDAPGVRIARRVCELPVAVAAVVFGRSSWPPRTGSGSSCSPISPRYRRTGGRSRAAAASESANRAAAAHRTR